jgi:hypothetical protein
MLSKDNADKDLGKVYCSDPCGTCLIVYSLAESIYEHSSCIMTAGGTWQLRDEVHTDGTPSTFWDLGWYHETSWFLITRFVTLALHARSHMMSHILVNDWPVIHTGDQLKGLIAAQVDRPWRIMA